MPATRQVAHFAIALLFWMLMITMWVVLFLNSSATGQTLFSAGQKVGIMAAAVIVITLVWVQHNLRIFECKGARRGRSLSKPRTDVDRLGRRTVWEFYGGASEAMDASFVIIETHGNRKQYRSGHVRAKQ